MFGRRTCPTPAFGTMTAGLALLLALVLSSAPVARAADGRLSATPDTGAWHLRLLRADPPIDSTVAKAPVTIRLWFSEPVRIKATSVKVTDASGAAVALSPLSRAAAAAAPVVAKVSAPLAPGRYTVTWRTMGRDSHVVTGHYAFTIGAPRADAASKAGAAPKTGATPKTGASR